MKIEVWFEDRSDTIIIESDILPMIGDRIFLDDEEIHEVTGRAISLRQEIFQKDRIHEIDVRQLQS